LSLSETPLEPMADYEKAYSSISGLGTFQVPYQKK